MSRSDKVGSNAANPVVDVRHRDLARCSDESVYRSHCPTCKEGVLLVYRDPKTFQLMAEDNCILCGQRYKYLDIEELRAAEGG